MFREVNVSKTIAREPQQAFSQKKVLCRIAIAALAVITLCQSTGCNFRQSALRDAVMISYRDTVWAKRAYNLRYGNCERPYSDHFQNGFCAGYSELCNGGDGYVPAMPPAEYRSYEFQCAEGTQCVNSWFEGYPAGVAAAKKDGVSKYHDVLISRMINSAVSQENAENVLPNDVPIVNGGNGVNGGNATASYSAGATAPSQPLFQRTYEPTHQPGSSTRSDFSMPPMPSSYPASMTPVSTPIRQSAPSMRLPTAPTINSGAIPIISSSQTSPYAQPVPPIVTGSGVAAQGNNQPLPMAFKSPMAAESNRRQR